MNMLKFLRIEPVYFGSKSRREVYYLKDLKHLICFENLLHSHGLKHPADALSSDILTVCQYYCVHAVLK